MMRDPINNDREHRITRCTPTWTSKIYNFQKRSKARRAAEYDLLSRRYAYVFIKMQDININMCFLVLGYLWLKDLNNKCICFYSSRPHIICRNYRNLAIRRSLVDGPKIARVPHHGRESEHLGDSRGCGLTEPKPVVPKHGQNNGNPAGTATRYVNLRNCRRNVPGSAREPESRVTAPASDMICLSERNLTRATVARALCSFVRDTRPSTWAVIGHVRTARSRHGPAHGPDCWGRLRHHTTRTTVRPHPTRAFARPPPYPPLHIAGSAFGVQPDMAACHDILQSDKPP